MKPQTQSQKLCMNTLFLLAHRSEVLNMLILRVVKNNPRKRTSPQGLKEYMTTQKSEHPEPSEVLKELTGKDPEYGYLRTKLFMLQISLAAPLKYQSWYLDSGCSRHMTGERHMFQELELKPGGVVGFGGNQKGKIIGSGTIGYGKTSSIKNVLLVEGLIHNLLSISQLADNGYDVIFNQKSCTVVNQKDGSILFNGTRKNNIYKISISELVKQNAKCLLSVNDEQWVWHRKLGHVSLRRISQLNKLELVRGFPNLKFTSEALCEACQKGKFSKKSFKAKNIVSSSRPLELLHIDLFGPIKTASINGKKYGLVIVDDYSRWTWVKFLRSKDESHSVFATFCTKVQNEK